MLVVFDDDAADGVVFLVFLGRLNPWVRFQGLDREGNLCFLDLDDLYVDLLTNLEQKIWIFNERPVDFGDVDKPFQAFLDLDEDAEVDDAGNFSFDFVIDFVFADDLFLVLFLKILFGKDEFSFFWQCGNDGNLNALSYKLLQFIKDLVLVAVGDAGIMLGFQLGSWQKTL